MRNFGAAALVAALAIGTGQIAAQSRQIVQFTGGNDNAAVVARVTGQRYRDYVLVARKGQSMGVSLSADGSAYFNILAPGSDGTALYNSSIDGNDATGIALTADGEYVVRVYLMGNDADAGKTVPFTLSMTIM